MTKLPSFMAVSPLGGCLAIALSVSASGCGNDDPAYVIPVDNATADTQVNQLDDTELETICDSYANYVEAEVSFDTVSHALCLVAAQLSSFNPETCQAVFDECIAGAPDPLVVRAEVENGTTCRTSLRSCDASVGQLEGCLNVQLDTVVDIIDSLACAGASSESRQTASDLMTGVSACADLSDGCTEFAEPVTLQ